jgi:hypothetical protein
MTTQTQTPEPLVMAVPQMVFQPPEELTHQIPEPLIVAAPELLDQTERFCVDDSMWEPDKNGLPTPHFSVQEVSKVFFGNGPDWLRWRMRPDDKRIKNKETGVVTIKKGKYPEGYLILDGQKIEPKRTDAGARYFTLADVERMAHALAQGGHIDGAQLTNVIVLVKTVAKTYGVL